jgi:hypothetical protein
MIGSWFFHLLLFWWNVGNDRDLSIAWEDFVDFSVEILQSAVENNNLGIRIHQDNSRVPSHQHHRSTHSEVSPKFTSLFPLPLSLPRWFFPQHYLKWRVRKSVMNHWELTRSLRTSLLRCVETDFFRASFMKFRWESERAFKLSADANASWNEVDNLWGDFHENFHLTAWDNG